MKSRIVSVVLLMSLVGWAGAAPSMERTATIIGSRVQIHEAPDGDSAAVGLVGKDAVVDVIGRAQRPSAVGSFIDFWYHVGYRGKTGWIFGQFMNLSSRGRGLARIFTAEELDDYCACSSENLFNLREAHAYAVLVDASTLFISDIKQMSADPILSVYGQRLEAYRLFATCLLAVGYAGTGAIGDAQKIRGELGEINPGTPLPDKTTLGTKIDEIDLMIRGAGGAPR